MIHVKASIKSVLASHEAQARVLGPRDMDWSYQLKNKQRLEVVCHPVTVHSMQRLKILMLRFLTRQSVIASSALLLHQPVDNVSYSLSTG